MMAGSAGMVWSRSVPPPSCRRFWFIAKRGVLRWVALAVLAVALVVVIFFRAGVVAVALVSVLLLLLGGAAARHALRHTAEPWLPTSRPVPAYALVSS